MSYLSDGKTKTVDLGDRPLVLSMTAEEIGRAGFKTASGSVSVYASYIGSPEDIADKSSEDITLEKRIDPRTGSLSLSPP
jgi:hypothetical protein